MSGHSRWNNIKHKKAKGDAAKGKLFTKIGREIVVAVKQGGSDPESNSRLRDLIAKARSANIPNDNVMRSIKKAAGELGSVNYESIVYEGYGTSGIAVIVEALTDNKNRTAADVRHCFDKYGGSMGTTGCVSYMFETKGVLLIERKNEEQDDEFMMLALDNGADDFNADEDIYEILTQSAVLGGIREVFEKQNAVVISSEVMRIPVNKIAPPSGALETFLKMIEKLDDLDDVQNVFHNADLPEDESDEG